MKIIATLTAEEKNKTLEGIEFDPCTYIKCSEIDCDECPLHNAAEALRRAQDNYKNAINRLPIEGE